MEKRVLLFIFLTFLVLYGYQALFMPPVPVPDQQEATEGIEAVEQPTTQAEPEVAQGLAAESLVAPPAPPPAEVVQGDTEERDVRVETPNVIAVFTNRGALLKSWRLKNYNDELGEPLELVATELTGAHPLPFSLVTDDPAMTSALNTALFSVRGAPQGGIQTTPTTLTFDYQDSSGLSATKTFRLEPVPYVIEFQSSVGYGGGALLPQIAWGPAVGNPRPSVTRWAKSDGGLTYGNGELTRFSQDDLVGEPSHQGTFAYAGVDDHYFLTGAIQPGESTVTYRRIAVPPADPAGDELYAVGWSIQGDNLPQPLAFFAGPKDFDVLESVDADLVRAIDFGIFAVIVVPLLRTLNWIYGLLGNYGWSIVLLTMIINAVMFPLRHKSVVSMRKMQEIQPEAKAIQERYAKLKSTDPAKQKMNQELMALYRERGVNPAGGCLPMLLTMPVLFAFYSLLTVAIELRGAPFFLWIHDLSVPDPYFVTPVLMGASQMWQQWMTPTAGVDPTQQKVMRLMPLMFMFFMLWLPAGVTLYWLVSNVWTIGQTYLTNYLIGPPIIKTVRPPAERRVKRAGAGRTKAAEEEK